MKKRLRDRIKDWWDGLSSNQQALLYGICYGSIIGGSTTFLVTKTVMDIKTAKEMNELVDVGAKQACLAYDQGVYDGATNPGLLRNLNNLGRLDELKNQGMI